MSSAEPGPREDKEKKTQGMMWLQEDWACEFLHKPKAVISNERGPLFRGGHAVKYIGLGAQHKSVTMIAVGWGLGSVLMMVKWTPGDGSLWVGRKGRGICLYSLWRRKCPQERRGALCGAKRALHLGAYGTYVKCWRLEKSFQFLVQSIKPI